MSPAYTTYDHTLSAFGIKTKPQQQAKQAKQSKQSNMLSLVDNDSYKDRYDDMEEESVNSDISHVYSTGNGYDYHRSMNQKATINYKHSLDLVPDTPTFTAEIASSGFGWDSPLSNPRNPDVDIQYASLDKMATPRSISPPQSPLNVVKEQRGFKKKPKEYKLRSDDEITDEETYDDYEDDKEIKPETKSKKKSKGYKAGSDDDITDEERDDDMDDDIKESKPKPKSKKKGKSKRKSKNKKKKSSKKGK